MLLLKAEEIKACTLHCLDLSEDSVDNVNKEIDELLSVHMASQQCEKQFEDAA